jgi:Putative peptidoglycan binding domain
MMSLGLRQLQCAFDPWNIAAVIPAGLTLCVIAYAGLAWTEGLGEAKPVTPTVQQAAPPASPAPAAPLPSSQSGQHPQLDGLSAHERPPFPQAGEATRAAEVDDLSTSQADPAVVHASSITLTHEWQPRSEGQPSLLKSEAEQPPPLSSPARDVMITEHARDVQRRLTALGYYKGSVRGSWGPLSRQSLAAFKRAHQLPADDAWDAQTEAALFNTSAQALPSYVGVWALDASACSARGDAKEFIPLVIDRNRARASDASCSFRNKREVEGSWDISAQCTSPGESWTARIRLTVADARLTWTSERGTEQYVWCGPLRVAGLR